MAALAGCGVDNVLVDVDGEELPIMDGSAQEFVDIISRAGIKNLTAPPHTAYRPRGQCARKGQVHLDRAARYAVDQLQCSLQGISARIRRVVDLEWQFPRTGASLAPLASAGTLKLCGPGASPRRLITQRCGAGGRSPNPEGLRFDDEPVRHKILDCVGDLFLAGGHVRGYVRSERAGTK